MGTAAQQIDQQKFDRLKSVAEGGKEGLAQYDAAQASVAAERAHMASGLASEARTAGYHGPAIAGAPVGTLHPLDAGLSPFNAALSADKASFSRNIVQGGIANLRYLDQAKAAIGPTLAAARKGGGGGGGGGKGSGNPGNLTDTQLRQALLSAASEARKAQIAAIHESETRAARGANQAGYIDVSGPQYASEVNRIKWSNSAPAPTLPPSPRQRSGLANIAAAAPVSAPVPLVTAAANAAQAKVGQYQKLLAQRVAAQRSTETAPIVPLATQIGTQAGIDPLLLSGLLGPSQEATYQRALAAQLPKTTKPVTPKSMPIPVAKAASTAGLNSDEASKALGVTYLRPGYTGNSKDGYTSDTGSKAHGKDAVGNLVQDITSRARTAAGQGFDFNAFIASLDSYLPASVVKAAPAAVKLAAAIAQGYFVTAPQPVAPVNPYQAYYERQFPPVTFAG